jgi:hypothetical protein
MEPVERDHRHDQNVGSDHQMAEEMLPHQGLPPLKVRHLMTNQAVAGQFDSPGGVSSIRLASARPYPFSQKRKAGIVRTGLNSCQTIVYPITT